MIFTKAYTVDKTITIPLYEGGKKFIGTVSLTLLDEMPTMWQISDQPDVINENRWKYAISGETTATIVDSSVCSRCYLIVTPVVPEAIAHVRVDVSIAEDLFQGENGDTNGGSELKTTVITFFVALAIMIVIGVIVMKKLKKTRSSV